ncbi:hypothetical protein ACPUD8_10830 [Brevibacterium sp. FAM 25378]|uniref:hypothetical protein n=1 Tax=unclassified Brevibacterium TaxID=2614124 RepID=UPI00109285BC|nr:hypothetical protein [Brevibacterium sp. S22]
MESAMEICPSADKAEDVVIYFSTPVGTRDELEPSVFALTFTNALDEVVTFVEEDSESTPCTGFDEIYDLVKTWSDLTVEITGARESVIPTDEELQEIADAGNTWLSVVERDELNFSLNPGPEDIGR